VIETQTLTHIRACVRVFSLLLSSLSLWFRRVPGDAATHQRTGQNRKKRKGEGRGEDGERTNNRRSAINGVCTVHSYEEASLFFSFLFLCF
jgi:hypothetical protein